MEALRYFMYALTVKYTYDYLKDRYNINLKRPTNVTYRQSLTTNPKTQHPKKMTKKRKNRRQRGEDKTK